MRNPLAVIALLLGRQAGRERGRRERERGREKHMRIPSGMIRAGGGSKSPERGRAREAEAEAAAGQEEVTHVGNLSACVRVDMGYGKWVCRETVTAAGWGKTQDEI